MADKTSGSGGTTQIIVAIIGVIGVVSAALFGNWDKIFGGRATAPGTAASAITPASATQTSAAPDAPLSSSQPVTSPAESAAVDISGAWHDTDGYSYVVAQQGRSFTYRQIIGGNDVGSGTGSIDGRRLAYRFASGSDRGTCAAEVEAGDRAFSGICRIGADSWPFSVTR